MKVSVIIPVYNAAPFIEKAIISVLQQNEVKEIIVVNDGSTDNSLEILQQLQQTDNRIKIYHHENKYNKGRSASRNLGILNATGNFIAFLDADDYFLPNRFAYDKQLFQEIENCDGVYNAVGFHYYRAARAQEMQKQQLYTVNQKLSPDFLFEALLSGKYGHFQIDGLTVKKSVFDKIGFFNEDLVVAEDTEIFWKMAIKCRLETGIIEQPLAMRGAHDNNVFDNKELYATYTIKMFETLLVWCLHHQVAYAIKDNLLKWIWLLKHKQKNKLSQDIKYWGVIFFSQPKLLFSIFSIKYFPIVRYRKMLFPFLYRKG